MVKEVNKLKAEVQKTIKQPEATVFVYVGPTLKNGVLKENTVIQGTLGIISKEYDEVIRKCPAIKEMIIPVEQLAESRDLKKQSGNILNKLFNEVTCSNL